MKNLPDFGEWVNHTHSPTPPALPMPSRFPSPSRSVLVVDVLTWRLERGSGGCETPPSHDLSKDGVVVGAFPFRHSKREWEGEWWA